MTIFEELASLDRPIVDFSFPINGKVMQLKARRLNAMEQDAMDAFYSDEYARLIIEKTESREGSKSELEQMKGIYATQTREALTAQLLETRAADVERIALESVGFNLESEMASIGTLPDGEREAYIEKRRVEVAEARKGARQEIQAEYDVRPLEELVDLISQMNVNVKAITEAQVSKATMFLYYALIDDSGKRICPSIEKVRESFTTSTILNMVKEVDRAFVLQSAPDLPFVSPDDNTHDGQPSSSGTSEAVTKTGGKRTKTTRANSKSSTTPAASTPSKSP